MVPILFFRLLRRRVVVVVETRLTLQTRAVRVVVVEPTVLILVALGQLTRDLTVVTAVTITALVAVVVPEVLGQTGLVAPF